MAAGSMFIMWLGERITDKGIGNGISFIIMVGIIARLPFSITAEAGSRLAEQGFGLIMLIIELIIFLFVIGATILLVQAEPKSTGTICQENCRPPPISVRCAEPSVHPVKSQCSRCNADYLCTGNYVSPSQPCRSLFLLRH